MRRPAILAFVAAIALAGGCVQQAKPPSASTVADVPDYPAAVRTALSERADAEHGFAKKAEASWTSADPFATVVAYYQKAIAERGWTITSTKSEAAKVEWELAKSTSVAKVEIKQEPGTQVTIKVERRDR